MAVVEREITAIPPLAPGEASLVDMHSVLNILSVLHGELTLLAYALTESEDVFRNSLARCEMIRRDLIDPGAALRHAGSIGEHARAILEEVEAALRAFPDQARSPHVEESVANIRSVFLIFSVRAQELVTRARAPGQWIEVPIEDLRRDFHEVFSAIEKNSRGRYRIIYNLALQEATDYYVDFVIESQNGRAVALPLVFKDVMRDLIANARKYTRPGGTINAGLYESDALLRFTVQDTGCGIPPAEIESVVHYGQRGSNVAHVRTMGGGFGLTKAFLVTKQFSGGFWIRSELGSGTRISIDIPRPETAAA